GVWGVPNYSFFFSLAASGGKREERKYSRSVTFHMRITIRVTPRSSKNTLTWEEGNEGNEGQQGQLKARLNAPPVDGAANEALVTLLADRLHIPKRTIHIIRGAASRLKTVEIDNLTADELRSRLQQESPNHRDKRETRD